MQFTILTALWATLYVAIALTSFRYSTPFFVNTTYAICYLTIAGVAVVAFERRSTPLFGFFVFALTATFANEIVMPAVVPVMLALGTPTGSNEYMNLTSLLSSHALIVCGLIGYVFGAVVVAMGRRTGVKSDDRP